MFVGAGKGECMRDNRENLWMRMHFGRIISEKKFIRFKDSFVIPWSD